MCKIFNGIVHSILNSGFYLDTIHNNVQYVDKHGICFNINNGIYFSDMN